VQDFESVADAGGRVSIRRSFNKSLLNISYKVGEVRLFQGNNKIGSQPITNHLRPAGKVQYGKSGDRQNTQGEELEAVGLKGSFKNSTVKPVLEQSPGYLGTTDRIKSRQAWKPGVDTRTGKRGGKDEGKHGVQSKSPSERKERMSARRRVLRGGDLFV